MKFLVDRCAGRSLADWLGSEGHESVYAVSLGPDPGDRALLQRAVLENRILITIDTDFRQNLCTKAAKFIVEWYDCRM
jgi:predicted nuclease of predicted toxin-antitoxin system